MSQEEESDGSEAVSSNKEASSKEQGRKQVSK